MLKSEADQENTRSTQAQASWSKKKAWLCWLFFSGLGFAFLLFAMLTEKSPAKVALLPGATTHGHYQIELACNVCHTPLMGVKQDACLSCHQEELNLANDTHPAKKFNDPTNAERLAVLNAKKCITCHREHAPERTDTMGLSLPKDYCFHCHQDIKELRPSHANFAYDSCAKAGCHNYHDNTALYENFLANHWGEPDFSETPTVPVRGDESTNRKTLSAKEQDSPKSVQLSNAIVNDWSMSAHAKAGVNCTDCHVSANTVESPQNSAGTEKVAGTEEVGVPRWSDHVTLQTCQKCHAGPVKGFLEARHGMRIAQGLTQMQPKWARQPMKLESHDKQLNCASCHQGHRYDTQSAAIDACMSCHNDEHTQAYKNSSHYKLWGDEKKDLLPAGSGVTCATCHMPRLRGEDGNITVMHNQNHNLRPNEKMIRSVCQNCHGIEFAIDSLADNELIKRCFEGRPNVHVESVKMAKDWFDAKQKEKQRRTNRRQTSKK